MYNGKIVLSPQDIYNKEFKVDARGYRPKEVDSFLDLIIKDYTEYIAINKKLKEDNEDLIRENNHLKAEIRKLRDLINMDNSNTTSTMQITNVDLLKRISQLEKTVYGKN